MTAAVTLNEAAKEAANNGDDLKAGIIQLYADKSDFLRNMKFEGISGNSLEYEQEGELSTTAFRGIGEQFIPNEATFGTQTASLAIAGGDIEIDRFILQTQGEQVRSRQTTAKVKGLAIGITDTLINGSKANNPRVFNGLAASITESTQKIANGNSSGGDPLSLSNLDLLIASVNSPTHLLMNPKLLLRFQQAARSSTFPNVLMDKDDIGNQFIRYGDLPILVGYPLAGKNGMLLPYAEANPGGGSAVGTSIYALNLDEDGVVGISNGGISVRDLGEANDAPQEKIRIEWYLGLAIYSQFAAARLWGIKDAAIVN